MHDANGTPLKVGDVVMIPAVVTQLHAGENYCNVSVETVFGRRPDGLKENLSAINTGVLVLHQKSEPTVLEETGVAEEAPAESEDTPDEPVS